MLHREVEFALARFAVDAAAVVDAAAAVVDAAAAAVDAAVVVVADAAVVVAADAVVDPDVQVEEGCCELFSCDAGARTFLLIGDCKDHNRMASYPRARPTREWPSGTSGRSVCHKAGRRMRDAFRAPSRRASSGDPSA